MSSLQPMQESNNLVVRNVGDKMSEFLANLRYHMDQEPSKPSQEGGGVFEKLRNRLVSRKDGSDWRSKVHQRKKLFGL